MKNYVNQKKQLKDVIFDLTKTDMHDTCCVLWKIKKLHDINLGFACGHRYARVIVQMLQRVALIET